jgi:hypothetical protein
LERYTRDSLSLLFLGSMQHDGSDVNVASRNCVMDECSKWRMILLV